MRRTILFASARGPRGRASAETWPSRPIRAIIPFGPGSAVDVVPRIVLSRCAVAAWPANRGREPRRRGRHSRVGGGRRAEPDGYTLLVHSSAHTITPALYPNLNYDIVRDFVAVGAIGSVPNVMIISPSKGFKTVQEYVAAAKANPAWRPMPRSASARRYK